MPRLSPIDKSVDNAPIRRFLLANEMQSLRLQTGVTYDKVDPKTNQVMPGTSSSISWIGPVLATNRPDWIEAIEKSYAFTDGDIIDMDILDAKAKRVEEDTLVAKLKADPSFAAEMRKQLDSLEKPQGEDKQPAVSFGAKGA